MTNKKPTTLQIIGRFIRHLKRFNKNIDDQRNPFENNPFIEEVRRLWQEEETKKQAAIQLGDELRQI